MSAPSRLAETLNMLPGSAPLGIDAFNLLRNLGAAIAMGIMIASAYKYTRTPRHAGVFEPLQFIMLCGTVSLIVAFVQSSLSLSLGLLGAISIIRYRTAIKDPEELIYIFLTIAAGIGAGVGYRVATAASVGLLLSIGLIHFAFNKLRATKPRPVHYAHLTLLDVEAIGPETAEQALVKHFGGYRILATYRTDQLRRYSIELDSYSAEAFNKFEREMIAISPHFELEVLDSSDGLPLQ